MANVAITGAGRGIGLELTRQHLGAGDRIYALVRNPGGAEALNALAAGSGGKVTVHAMEVADDASVKAGAASTGDGPIDILYNVAGVAGKIEPQLESTDWDDFDNAIEIMVKGPLRVLQAFLPRLQAGSKMINVTSQLAASTWPYGGFYPLRRSQGRAQPADALGGDRSQGARRDRRAGSSRLGQDRHGRPQCRDHCGGKCRRVAQPGRELDD
jgi:NAD(P)-dependent dehydrogenase (short-subunit alcohol dehydrogenase family)